MSGSDSRVMACATEEPHASQGVWGCSGSHCLLRDYSQISPFLGEEGKCKFWLEICHCECDPSLSSVCGLQLEWDTAPRPAFATSRYSEAETDLPRPACLSGYRAQLGLGSL